MTRLAEQFEQIMQQRGTVAAVLKILHAESSAVPWNPHYRLKLISLSIYVLQYLVPILSSDFDHCNGSIEFVYFHTTYSNVSESNRSGFCYSFSNTFKAALNVRLLQPRTL